MLKLGAKKLILSWLIVILATLSGCAEKKNGDASFSKATNPNSSPDTGSSQDNLLATELAAQKERLLQRQREKDQDWKELVEFAQSSYMPVQGLYKSRCYSCHDRETPLPFYGKPFPDKNSIKKHRDDGLKALDFSTQFPLRSQGDNSQLVLLRAIKTSLLDKTMPLKIYTTLLPWKKISNRDRTRMLAWIDPLIIELEKFEEKYADDSDNSLDAKVFSLFQNKCFQCHANGNDRGGYGGMENLESLWQGALVDRQNPEQSKLLGLINRKLEPAMPPSPRQALTSEEIQLVEDWLQEKFK